MLTELRIRDLAIIDRLDLTFAPGFNVLTGETGAGKSIIIDAVNLLLGDRASADVVRAGAERTEVEGVFQLNPAVSARLTPLLTEHGLEGDHPDLLVLAREVRANGRSVARVERPRRDDRTAGRDRRAVGGCAWSGRAPVAACANVSMSACWIATRG